MSIAESRIYIMLYVFGSIYHDNFIIVLYTWSQLFSGSPQNSYHSGDLTRHSWSNKAHIT